MTRKPLPLSQRTSLAKTEVIMNTSENILYGAIVLVFVCIVAFFAVGALKGVDQQIALVNQMSVANQTIPVLQKLDALDAERREQAERLAQR